MPNKLFNAMVQDTTIILDTHSINVAHAVASIFEGDSGRLVLSHIFVDPLHRRNKLATQLFNKVVDYAQQRHFDFVECIPLSTKEATSFWQIQKERYKGIQIGPVILFPLNLKGYLRIAYYKISYNLRYLLF